MDYPKSPSKCDDTEKCSCRPLLPKLFVEAPPAAEHPIIELVSKRLEEYISNRFAKGDIDSLSVAVVTSAGSLFEKNYGVIRGNETASSPPTSHS